MTPERYKKLTDWLEGHPALRESIILLNRWLPLVPFVCYPVLLVLLNLRWFTMLTIGRGGGALDFMQVIARAILVPGLAFWLGTILRARLNFPRPYEQPGFVPLVSKETHGNSCPSRHALSAAVLGMVWLYFYPAVGVVMLAIAFGVAAFLNAESPTMLMNAMFCLAGIGWATINVNSFPMVVEMCSGSDVGRYTGFYYTASMAAQVITPMFSGFLMDKVGMTVLFPYAALFVAGAFVTMLFVRHGDSRPIAAKGLEALDVDD